MKPSEVNLRQAASLQARRNLLFPGLASVDETYLFFNTFLYISHVSHNFAHKLGATMLAIFFYG